MAEVTERLRQRTDLALLPDEPLAAHTSFGIGGPADLMVLPQTAESLAGALADLRQVGLSPHFLGLGTNVLVSDAGVRGVVIKTAGGLLGLSVADSLITAAAGESLAAVCHLAADAGLSGLEFSAGIPGTVGGALIMNAGAHGGDISSRVEWVEIATPAGELQRIAAAEAVFGYRESSFNLPGQAVTRVGLRLAPSTPETVREQVCELLQRRCAKQPISCRSAGSIFKRPPGDYAGRLIQAVRGNGLQVGDAAVSDKHANFIVNLGHARAQDVLELIQTIRARVHEQFGVDLEPEIRLLGEPPST
ncbi:MAG TPA: UDP-N-acetylmuramate dehydrogenase [Armatimonadota bacterium]